MSEALTFPSFFVLPRRRSGRVGCGVPSGVSLGGRALIEPFQFDSPFLVLAGPSLLYPFNCVSSRKTPWRHVPPLAAGFRPRSPSSHLLAVSALTVVHHSDIQTTFPAVACGCFFYKNPCALCVACFFFSCACPPGYPWPMWCISPQKVVYAGSFFLFFPF